MKAIAHIEMDIDYMPDMNHPLVQAFISPDVKLTEYHIECLYEAIQAAKEDLRRGE